MSIIFLLVILLFWHEIDLFASMFLAIYSSVFVVLSLIFVYLQRYITRSLLDSASESPTNLELLMLLVLLVCCWTSTSVGGLAHTGNGVLSVASAWSLLVNYSDFYAVSLNYTTATSSLMHAVLYKMFNFEVLFFNIYLFFALVLSTIILLLLKLLLNPAIIGRLLATTRLHFWFFFPTNTRVRVANKLKRQVRRKNSSLIRFK